MQMGICWGLLCGSGTFHRGPAVLPLQYMTSWKESPEGRERSPWGGEEWGTEGDAEVDGCRIPAGPLGTALGEGRDPQLGFSSTCGLVAGGALHLLCFLGGLERHSDPAKMERVVMGGTKQGLA